MHIDPIPEMRREQVSNEASRYMRLVEEEFEISLPAIPIHFNLSGGTAGMYCVKRRQRMLRFNPYLFAKYWQDNFATTIPHEVAHYAADALFSHSRIKPHGKEWQSLMRFFRADPQRTCEFDLAGIPVRQVRRFHYYCRCDTHQLTSIRHNRVRSGRQRYYCRQCSSELIPLAS